MNVAMLEHCTLDN